MTQLQDLPTPALLIDLEALDHNIETMARVRPGRSLRPHVKAFKCTALARHVRDVGDHETFCCATLREMEGMVAAGLHTDLLLANETLDTERLGALVASSPGIVTVAVDSAETVTVAATAGASVLIDVDVGLPRCGCPPDEAGALAELARSLDVEVRGVMGYEGHVVGVADRERRTTEVAASMALLREALDAVGGGLSSAGGTGTYDLHDWADEVQAGSYLLMDTAYAELGLPFRQALSVLSTVISTSEERGWGVVDAGLKAFGMDHGNPSMPGWSVLFCSDEHTTFCPTDGGALPAVGTRLRMLPAHVDPTVAYHERMYVLRGERVVDTWPVDLRGW
ncbi:MAG: alanine racemase [Actinomycetota bacterium]|nr:alanine racemase [Actinomycetota bacterium]